MVTPRPGNRTVRTNYTRPPGVMPRSPAEALEPTRAPSRPKGSRTRREVKRLGPTLRFVNGLLTFCFLLLAVCAASVMWMSSVLDRAGPLDEARTVVIRKGEGSRDIAQRLEQEGIIGSQHVFVAYYMTRQLASWFGGKSLQLKAGDYEMQPRVSMRQVSDIIGEGKVSLFRMTIPEGFTSYQIVERLRAEPGLTGEITAVPPEGSLLPDTYHVSRGATRQSVLDLMQQAQARFLQQAWTSRRPDIPLQNMEEALILASIVQRETGRNDKHEDIAAVFSNRIRRSMPLQSDPTILYGKFGGQVDWGRPIYRSEIQEKTAHNTYQIKGLPPTPICNPGREAIEAVLNPSQNNHLYFVASGNGASVFSQTLDEHNAAVANWRKVEKDIRARQAEAKNKAEANAGPQAAQDAAAPAVAPQVAPEAAAGAAATAAGAAAATGAAAVAAGAQVPPLPVRKPKRQ